MKRGDPPKVVIVGPGGARRGGCTQGLRNERLEQTATSVRRMKKKKKKERKN